LKLSEAVAARAFCAKTSGEMIRVPMAANLSSQWPLDPECREAVLIMSSNPLAVLACCASERVRSCPCGVSHRVGTAVFRAGYPPRASWAHG
jgi:hypothetical protein